MRKGRNADNIDQSSTQPGDRREQSRSGGRPSLPRSADRRSAKTILMGFFHAYAAMWKKYAVFRGRTRRRDYWMAILVHWLIGNTFSLLTTIMENIVFFKVLLFLYFFASITPWLAIIWRRLHDIGISGLWFFVQFLIPRPLGTLLLHAVACIDSRPGTNAYGPNPKENTD